MSHLDGLTAILSPDTEPGWDYTPGEEWSSARKYPRGCVVTYKGQRYVATKPDLYWYPPATTSASQCNWWRIDRLTFPIECRPYSPDEPRAHRRFNRPRGRVLSH